MWLTKREFQKREEPVGCHLRGNVVILYERPTKLSDEMTVCYGYNKSCHNNCDEAEACEAAEEGCLVITEETEPNTKNCFGYNTEWYCEVRCSARNACADQSSNFKEILGTVVILEEETP